MLVSSAGSPWASCARCGADYTLVARPNEGWFETDDELYYVAEDGTVYLHTTPDAGHGHTIPRLPDAAWQTNPRHIDPEWHEWAEQIERKARGAS